MLYYLINKIPTRLTEAPDPVQFPNVVELTRDQYKFAVDPQNAGATEQEIKSMALTPPTAAQLLSQAKTAKSAEVTSAYQAVLDAGFDAGTFRLALQEKDQIGFNKDIVLMMLEDDPAVNRPRGNEFTIVDIDGAPQLVQKSDYKSLLADYGQYVRNVWGQKKTYDATIAAAATVEEVEAITVNFTTS